MPIQNKTTKTTKTNNLTRPTFQTATKTNNKSDTPASYSEHINANNEYIFTPLPTIMIMIGEPPPHPPSTSNYSHLHMQKANNSNDYNYI